MMTYVKRVWFCVSLILSRILFDARDQFRGLTGLFLFQSCFIISSLSSEVISCQLLKDIFWTLSVNGQSYMSYFPFYLPERPKDRDESLERRDWSLGLKREESKAKKTYLF